MKKLGLCLIILVFAACGNNAKKVEKENNSVVVSDTLLSENEQINSEFEEYLSKFNELSLPIEFDGCGGAIYEGTLNLFQFDGKKFNDFADEYGEAFGKITINEKFCHNSFLSCRLYVTCFNNIHVQRKNY
jgi:hypothetical protein